MVSSLVFLNVLRAAVTAFIIRYGGLRYQQ